MELSTQFLNRPVTTELKDLLPHRASVRSCFSMLDDLSGSSTQSLDTYTVCSTAFQAAKSVAKTFLERALTGREVTSAHSNQ